MPGQSLAILSRIFRRLLCRPNHVLPILGRTTARFYSPLNVDMYMKKSSLISYSKKGLEQVGQDIIKLAQVEGLEAHAKAIEVRMESR